MEYIGETGRNFTERYKEHLRTLSPNFDHSQTTGHLIKLESFSIVDRESYAITRTIKEAMYIMVNDLPLNRNLGKYQQSHIWDGVLQDMLAPCLQWPLHHLHHNPTLGHPLNKWGPILPWGTYVSPQGASPSHPSYIFAPYFFHQNFGAKFLGITFSLRPEEAFLVLTSWKFVWIHV